MPNCKCVVAGCKSGYASDRKRRKLEGIKNPSLFSVPSDPSVFKKWSSVIPLKNNVLTFKDKVCEEHFKDSDIERHNVIGLSTGETYVVDRKRLLLKPNAVPSIFKNLSTPKQSYKSERRKQPDEQLQDLLDSDSGNEELMLTDFDESEIEKKDEKETSAGTKYISEEKCILKPVSKIVIYSPSYQDNEFIKRKVPKDCGENLDDIGELVVPDTDKSEIERKIAKEFSADVKHTVEENNVIIKTDAVPSTFRNLLNCQVNEFKKRKPSVECAKSLHPAKVNTENIEKSITVPDTDVIDSIDRENVEQFLASEKKTQQKFGLIKPKPVPSVFSNSLNNQTNDSSRTEPHEGSIQDLIPQQINLKNTEKSVVYKIDNLRESNTDFSFSFLVENLDKVIKPSSRWGFTSHEDFIVCVYWNEKFDAEKKIIFNSELEIRVFILDIELSEVYTIESLADVSKLIRCIENYVICAGYRKGKDGCKIYMQKNYFGRPRTYCDVCATEQKKLYYNVVKRSKKSLFRSKLHLYQRIAHENRKNANLRKKVFALQRLLKDQKALEKSKSF